MADQPQQTPPPAGGNPDVDNNKALAIVGYIIPILFFIPLLNESSKNSPFAKFHANQQLVLLISAFAGAVTALQAGYQWQSSLPAYVLGTLIVETIVLELGPVLIGLVLAGRIGARYAAELGTMWVTEQIDALESLGRSPASHLIIPRVLASTIMLPVLVVIADVVAVGTGWIGVKQVLPITDWDFRYGAQYYWRPFDAWYSLIKAVSFGCAIGVISCYMGFNTQQGAEGVGKSTTAAVVTSSVIILLLNVTLARLLLHT